MKNKNNKKGSNVEEIPQYCKMKVSALFTRKNSIYKKLGIDAWDIDRDAKQWPGGNAIIAHPPCRAWGDLRALAKPREGEKELAIWAVHQIQFWGGVLEHPANSRLWPDLNLPLRENRDQYGGWTLCIDQFWFGHKARKRSNLYIVGIEPKDIPAYSIRYENVTTTVERLSRQAREATPEPMAKWLIELAQKIQYNKTVLKFFRNETN